MPVRARPSRTFGPVPPPGPCPVDPSPAAPAERYTLDVIDDNAEDELWGLLEGLRIGEEGAVPPKAPPWRAAGGSATDDEPCCESCGSRNMMVEQGQNVCRDCATIQSRVISTGAEWRFYSADDGRSDDPTRCGMPTNHLLPKSSLGSMVGGRWNDNRDHRRLRQFQMWNSMPYWERTLYYVFERLTSNASNAGIPSKVLDDAKVLYKTASEKKISRGDNKDGLIASCIYHACILNKVPRSTKEVARMFNIDVNVLTKGNARFQELLHMTVECGGPDDYIPRFGSKLNMDYDDIHKCRAITKRLDALEIVSENAPTSVAAGAIFFYCQTYGITAITKKQVADVCEVSEVTVLKCFKRISKYKEHVLGQPSTA